MDKNKHLLELYIKKRFSQVDNISKEKMLKVDSEEVTRVIKKNHSHLICTCNSSGKTGHSSFCRHKQFFMVYPFLEEFSEKINKLIEEYNGYLENKLPPVSHEAIIKDLRSILC